MNLWDKLYELNICFSSYELRVENLTVLVYELRVTFYELQLILRVTNKFYELNFILNVTK